MDIGEFLKLWGSLLAIAISTGGTIYAWLTSRSNTNAKLIDEMQKRLDRHSSKIDKVETELSHLPGKDSIHELKLEITEMKGEVGQLAISLSSVDTTAKRLERFLLEHGNK